MMARRMYERYASFGNFFDRMATAGRYRKGATECSP
jgi:hypothetical protein